MDPPPPPPPPLSSVLLIDPTSPHSSRILNEGGVWPPDHDPLPNIPGAKLRLMCSYGGHIMPRPHDKSLTYVGGETRMVAVDRHFSLKDLCSRLSRTLLHGRPFTLKYQLPNEDLDNLITVTTDEDLENMIEEYERLTSKPSRLRIFLFFNKPDTAVSMGSLLDDAKSETWFVDALNNSGILSRVVSDSAAVECLVSLDNDGVPPAAAASGGGSSTDLESGGNKHNVKINLTPDVQSVPNSPIVENSSSSYGSSSSACSMANLPSIRVRVDENGGSRFQQEQRAVNMEEQFAQIMSFGGSSNEVAVKQDDDNGYGISSSAAALAPNVPAIPAPIITMVSGSGGDNVNRGVSDIDPHYGGAINSGFRKPPLPLQLVPPRNSAAFSLPSPDSVASDSSIASANSFPKTVYYQDQVQAPAMPNVKSEVSDPSQGLQREQQVQDSAGYTITQQLDQNQQLQQLQQQQFVYLHHPAAGTGGGQVPVMSSYYPVYASPSHQQQLNHPIIGQQHQQYPVYNYVMSSGPTQPYNMTLQSNMADPNMVGRPPLLPQSSAAASSAAAYKDGTPSVYQTPVPVAPSNPSFVQIPSNQFQQQYVGLAQNIHHPPPQPMAVNAPSATTNYGYDYGGTTQDQVYYTQQQQQQQAAPQYQSMNPAAALSDVSKQFPADNIQQQSRTSQPV